MPVSWMATTTHDQLLAGEGMFSDRSDHGLRPRRTAARTSPLAQMVPRFFALPPGSVSCAHADRRTRGKQLWQLFRSPELTRVPTRDWDSEICSTSGFRQRAHRQPWRAAMPVSGRATICERDSQGQKRLIARICSYQGASITVCSVQACWSGISACLEHARRIDLAAEQVSQSGHTRASRDATLNYYKGRCADCQDKHLGISHHEQDCLDAGHRKLLADDEPETGSF